jgi:hypothetical protein
MALCAVALCLQTSIFFKESGINYSFAIFLFFSTLLSYNLHFHLASLNFSSTDQLKWFRRNSIVTHALNTLSVFAILYSISDLRDLWIWIGLAILLNAAYTAPLLLNKPIKLPLVFTAVKSYFIGFTWALATVVLPLLLLKTEPGMKEVILFLHRFLLVSTATLLFDYRDRFSDLQQGIRTPANFLNEQQFRKFFILNIALLTLVSALLPVLFSSPLHWLQLPVSIYFIRLYKTSRKRSDDLFFLFYVDGSMFLSAAISLFLLI